MARVFISHSSVNNAQAMAMKEWLRAQGWDDVFLDLDPERGIKAGERWQQALRREAAVCEFVLFLISPAWLASRWCFAEFALADSMNKQIFAILIEPTPLQEIPAEISAEWQMVDLTPRTTSAVWKWTADTVEFATPQAVSFSEVGLQHLRRGLEEAGLDPRYFEWPPATEPDRPPYRGMRPLEADDAGIFFGREGPILDALDRLRGLKDAAPPRMFVILGASGAGKSSFLRAGVLPRLRRDVRHFRVLPLLRPGRAAMDGDTGLVAVLERAFKENGKPISRAVLREKLQASDDAVLALVRDLVSPNKDNSESGDQTPSPTLVVPIDQGEELFLAEGQEEGRRVLELLHKWMSTDNPRVLVLVTIRSDAYERLQSAPTLEGVRQQTFSLAPIPRGAFSEIIHGPARRCSAAGRRLQVDDQLRETLLKDLDTGGAKDALPLLAFTLERLFTEHGANGRLSLENYESLGRIRGSIDAAVQQAFRAADADRRIPLDGEARRLLLRRGLIPWLAGIDPETGFARRRVAPEREIPEESRPLIDLLVEQRLLTRDRDAATGETTLEPAHEALLRQWSLLDGWLQEDHTALAILESLKRAATEWDANNRDPNWLSHSGTRLTEAATQATSDRFKSFLSPTDHAYLEAARALEQSNREREARRLRRERTLHRATRLTALFAVAGLILAVHHWLDAQEQAIIASDALDDRSTALQVTTKARNSLRNTQTRFLTDRARNAHESYDHITAALLALETWSDSNFAPDVETHNALESVLYAASVHASERVLSDCNGPLRYVGLSSDGQRLLSVLDYRTDKVWDVSTGKVLATLIQDDHHPTSHAVFSPNAKMVVTFGLFEATLWNIEANRVVANLSMGYGTACTAIFSQDSQKLLTTQNNEFATLWDSESGTSIRQFSDNRSTISQAVFSADGRKVLTVALNMTATIWDTESGELLFVLDAHRKSIWSALFSPNGEWIVTTSEDEAIIWNVTSGKVVHRLLGHSGSVVNLCFSPDSVRFVTTSSDRTARTWHAASGESELILTEHSDTVVEAAFSPDGTKLLTVSADGVHIVWDPYLGDSLATLSPLDGEALDMRFDKGSDVLLFRSLDAGVRLSKFARIRKAPKVTRHFISTMPDVLDPQLFDFIRSRGRRSFPVWWVYNEASELVATAKSKMPRGLTRKQREENFLSPEPPRWYITGAGLEEEKDPAKWKPLWPYQSAAWREWQVKRDRGEEPALPAEEE